MDSGRNSCSNTLALLPCIAAIVVMVGIEDEGPDGRLMEAAVRPDFVVCETAAPCHPRIVSTWLPFVLGTGVAAKMHAMSGRKPIVLQVGSGLLSNEQTWTDLHLQRSIPPSVRMRPGEYRLMLADSFSDSGVLTKKAADLGFQGDSLIIVNGSVSPVCSPSDSTVKYTWDRRVSEVYGARWQMYRTWSTADAESLVSMACRGFVAIKTEDPLLQKDVAAFASLCSSSNPEAYVERFEVPCITPKRLLEEAKVEPEDIVVLLGKTERSIIQVVPEFFRLQSFKPAMLMIEASWEQVTAVSAVFSTAGYMMGPSVFSPDKPAHTVAVPRP